MKKVLAIIVLVIFTSCTQRGCQAWEKQTQYTNRSYQITLYSGGQAVYTDTFVGIVNEEQNTDGFYYFKKDTLIEVSGDYVIKSVE